MVIICEDTQQECFARRFLYGMGWEKHQLRIQKSPSGRGSGEQWVREKYVEEIRNHSRRNVRYAIAALVDGDTTGVSGRIQQFDNECIEQGVSVRSAADEVAIIIPTRNIETWINYLKGEEVDEYSIYPKLRYESECQPAVDKLLKMCKASGLPDEAPSSLKAACEEFRQRIQE